MTASSNLTQTPCQPVGRAAGSAPLRIRKAGSVPFWIFAILGASLSAYKPLSPCISFPWPVLPAGASVLRSVFTGCFSPSIQYAHIQPMKYGMVPRTTAGPVWLVGSKSTHEVLRLVDFEAESNFRKLTQGWKLVKLALSLSLQNTCSPLPFQASLNQANVAPGLKIPTLHRSTQTWSKTVPFF